MTRDDIIKLAREAGLEDDDSFVLEPHTIWYFDELMLERFAALVAAAEREACAKLCEEPGWNAANWCAKQIRARGEKK